MSLRQDPLRLLAYTACLLLCLHGCAGPGQPAYDISIDGLIMENHSQAWVSAARLLVPATGNFVSCGNIAPGGMCSTLFPETRYSGYPVEISWSQGTQIWSTGELDVKPSVEVVEAGSAQVMVVFAGPGVAGATLIPAPGGAE